MPIVTTLGPVVVNDDSISRVVPRTPDFPYAHVSGPAGSGPLEVVEEASALVARLQIATPLVPGGAHLPEPLMTISTVHGEVGGFSPKAVASSDVFQVW